ncbi:flagellar hook-associated protein FlgL [Pantoea sp. B65]|uniref:flagellar hook-associated protein FlgL n=1 Tax=Pantoea sp. B65 TaxID=2813359 RepID=UPI0039B4844C
MRVSTLTFTNTALNNFNRNNMQLSKVQTQISLDKRITKPSDDPIASSQLAQLRREQAAIGQYQHNISRLSGNLAQQEVHIDATSSTLMTMMDKIREANNGHLSVADMDGYGTELQALMESLIAQLNTRDADGNYQFGGTITDRPPVVQDPATGQWIYQGNDNQSAATVAHVVDIRVTTQLAQAFGSDMATLNQLQDLIGKMKDPTLPPSSYAEDMGQMLSGLQENHNRVAALYTDLGGRQNHLTLLNDAHSDNDVVNQQVIEQLQGLDYAEAWMNLMRYTSSNEAAYKSFVQVSQLSLFKLG